MKKLYTLLAIVMLSALGSRAGELKFWLGDTEITPGQTITYSQVEKEDFGGLWEVRVEPPLYVTSSTATSTLQVVAKCTSGHDVNMCCGGDCFSGKTITKTGLEVGAGEKLPLQFDWMDYVEDLTTLPVVTTEFTATDGAASASFILVIDPSAASLTVVEASDAVSYGPEGISYAVGKAAQLSLYSITGTQVLSTRVEGHGTISTHALRPGLYIYALRGGSKLTGKILVK